MTGFEDKKYKELCDKYGIEKQEEPIAILTYDLVDCKVSLSENYLIFFEDKCIRIEGGKVFEPSYLEEGDRFEARALSGNLILELVRDGEATTFCRSTMKYKSSFLRG